MKRDITVVGGGPIGLFVSSQLSKMGFDVLLLEEHSEIGNPSHCGGLFSPRIFEITGRGGVLHPARKARIYAPNGVYIEVGDQKIRGYVVDRVEFDRSLARKSAENGVDIHLKERVKKVNYPRVVTTQGEYESRVIIGCEGINSVVRRSMGIRAPQILPAVQAVTRYEVEREDMVYVFTGSWVAPEFFGWVIPIYDNLARVGLASYSHSWEHLKALMRKLKIKPLSVVGGGIPIGTVARTYARGMLIVGDAAGQVKATSGGGVYTGLLSAKCAVEATANALERGDYSEESLSSYETCWRSRIGKELKNALFLHRIYRKIRDEEFNKIIETLRDESIIKIINRYGDIDYPSRVVFKILRKKPSLLRYLSIPARLYRTQILASDR